MVVGGAVSTRVDALAATTLIVAVAVRVGATVSVAVTVCAPALVSVAEKVPWPLVSVESAGSATPEEVSLLVKWTRPV